MAADLKWLKDKIASDIRDNGLRKITGSLLQENLLAMVGAMEDGAVGEAVTITSNPQLVMYKTDERPSISVTDRNGNECIADISFKDSEKHCTVQWKDTLNDIMFGGKIYII